MTDVAPNVEAPNAANVPEEPKVRKVSSVKNLAFVLVTAGIIPFFICSLGIATHVVESVLLLKVLLVYTAVIVGHFSGVFTATALFQDYDHPTLSRWLIVYSLFLVVAATGLLFVTHTNAQLIGLIGLFLLMWLMDLLLVIKRIYPLWFFGLRTLATILIMGLLVLTKLTLIHHLY